MAQLKNPKTIHFLNGFSSAMAPALRGAPGTSEKTEIGAIVPPHARPPVQRRRPEAPARRRNRRTWENVSVGAADTKISSRGGVRPVEVAPGDMMALRRVGETNGLADWARRASPWRRTDRSPQTSVAPYVAHAAFFCQWPKCGQTGFIL